ncbi:RNA-binding protein 45 [Eumeta japonica]|uniref:RNA-binding protein 45 n=1 Tax=Eumeta variegata TaxID=151549 RepID=A0A4C1TTH4_EUMVA|nr:RNA-binding protein 45 [Eumeta japonica]
MYHHSKDEKAPFTRLFVICCKTLKEEDLERAFGEFGHIKNLHIPRDRNTGESKGIAYIQFSKTSEAAKALEALNGTILEPANRPVKVMVAANKHDQNQSSNINLGKYRRLFIVVPKIANEKEIKDHFSAFGAIESINLHKDKVTKQNKGFAYVQFHKFVDTARALEECDRKYKPVIATPKDELKRDRSTFESNVSLNSDSKTIVHNDYHSDGFFPRNEEFVQSYPVNRTLLTDGYKSVVVLCSPKLTQRHVESLFDIVQGMESCQYSVDIFGGYGKGIVTYSSHAAASYAVQKLDKFEYPFGETMHVKPEINQINQVAENLSNIVDNFKSAITSGKPTVELAQLAEVMARASSMIKAVTSGVTDTVVSEKNNLSSNNSICNVKLPPPQPLADINSPVAQRCFIVCKPSPPPMAMLRDVFSRFEGLIKVYTITNKNFGYALYTSEKSAREAISILHNCTIGGSHIKVLEADEKSSKKDDIKDDSKKIKLDTIDTDIN